MTEVWLVWRRLGNLIWVDAVFNVEELAIEQKRRIDNLSVEDNNSWIEKKTVFGYKVLSGDKLVFGRAKGVKAVIKYEDKKVPTYVDTMSINQDSTTKITFGNIKYQSPEEKAQFYGFPWMVDSRCGHCIGIYPDDCSGMGGPCKVYLEYIEKERDKIMGGDI